MNEVPSYKKPEGKCGEEILDLMDKDHTPIALWALSNIEVKEDDVTVDIGCGSGLNVKRFFEKSPKAKSYGVDYSSTSVKKSKIMNQKEVNAGNVIIKKADVLDIPFDDETFDIATAFSTVFFWPDIINAFKEVKRILKQGGKFYIIQGINGTDNYEPEDWVNDGGAVFYNDMEFKDLLREAGYSKITCFIRQLKENKKLIRTYDSEGFSEELIDETHIDDIDPEKTESPEWLCVMAQK